MTSEKIIEPSLPRLTVVRREIVPISVRPICRYLLDSGKQTRLVVSYNYVDAFGRVLGKTLF